MNSMPLCETGSVTARAALILVALYLALGVGAPWLLTDAPPSAQDVLATRACCATPTIAVAAKVNKVAALPR